VPGAQAVEVHQGSFAMRLDQDGDRFTGSFTPVAGKVYLYKRSEDYYMDQTALLRFSAR